MTFDNSRKAWNSRVNDHDVSLVDPPFGTTAAGVDTTMVLDRSKPAWKNVMESRPRRVVDGQTLPGSFANPAGGSGNQSEEHELALTSQDETAAESASLVRLPSLRHNSEPHSLAIAWDYDDLSLSTEVDRSGGVWQGDVDTTSSTTPQNFPHSSVSSREPTRFSSETEHKPLNETLLQRLELGKEALQLPQHLTFSSYNDFTTSNSTTNSVTSTGNTPPAPQRFTSHSTEEQPLSSTNMGYNTNGEVNPSAWSVSADSLEMMEPAEFDQSCSLNEGKDRDDDETATIQSFDSTTIASPAIAPARPPIVLEEASATFHPAGDVETPSTVSTAAESDDASLGDLHSLERSFGPVDAFSPETSNNHQRAQQHHRVPSWEQLPPTAQRYPGFDDFLHHSNAFATSQSLPPPYGPTQAAPSPWGRQRVTSFRNEGTGESANHAYLSHPSSPNDPAWHQQQQLLGQGAYSPQVPFLPGRGTPPIDNRMHHRQNQGSFVPYPMQQHQPPHLQQQRKQGGGFGPAMIMPQQSNVTPPRPRGPRLPPPQSPHRGGFAGGGVPPGPMGPLSGSARSSSEVLKTLLRKKACLYEPDTSRSVALVTWLVGRELALEFGFFSRQQLQAGVHACVADKIDAGVITRTKVNRCMQIILNSCFHYIIPRPDGTEENGDVFRAMFATEVEDDAHLLKLLPEPWTNVNVNRDDVLIASEAAELEGKLGRKGSEFVTPQSSPRLSSVSPPAEKGSPGGGRDDSIDVDDAHKRSVLLCFNENVRRAEDVFRCHNEFIRDTAHASHLQLSSQEWRMFFGHEAAGSPYLWGNVGIPVQYTEVHGSSHVDALGMMTSDEAGKFRTSWCTKRYDHDHELCGFGHAEVNNGWLRRNPLGYHYKDEMCPFITTISDKQTGQSLFVINECPLGASCEFAHSTEEIMYHPRRYKMRACQSAGRLGGCSLCDVCPHFHPIDTYRFPKKSDGRSSRHSKHAHQIGGSKGAPSHFGAPILLASPAPVSSFEEHLLLPGLRNLYRRQCAVVRSLVRNRGRTCHYSYFGDDDGLSENTSSRVHDRGLPTRP